VGVVVVEVVVARKRNKVPLKHTHYV